VAKVVDNSCIYRNKPDSILWCMGTSEALPSSHFYNGLILEFFMSTLNLTCPMFLYSICIECINIAYIRPNLS
jgi:hypothetical protein